MKVLTKDASMLIAIHSKPYQMFTFNKIVLELEICYQGRSYTISSKEK